MGIDPFCKSTLWIPAGWFSHAPSAHFRFQAHLWRTFLSKPRHTQIDAACMLAPPSWGILPQSLLTCHRSYSSKYNPAQEAGKFAWPCQPSATGGRRWQITAQPLPREGGIPHGSRGAPVGWSPHNSNTSGTPHAAFPPSLPYTSPGFPRSGCPGTSSQ